MSSVQIDTATLNKWLDKFRGLDKTLFREKVLLAIAKQQKDRIFLRTTSGKSTDGTPFKAYNPGYAKEAGKISVNDVNLTLTGKMLNSMTQTATDKEANIFFSNDDAADLAKQHDQLGIGMSGIVRPFFGISDQDKDTIFDDYLKTTNKLLKKEGFE